MCVVAPFRMLFSPLSVGRTCVAANHALGSDAAFRVFPLQTCGHGAKSSLLNACVQGPIRCAVLRHLLSAVGNRQKVVPQKMFPPNIDKLMMGIQMRGDLRKRFVVAVEKRLEHDSDRMQIDAENSHVDGIRQRINGAVKEETLEIFGDDAETDVMSR